VTLETIASIIKSIFLYLFMNKKQIYEYGLLYYPYNKTHGWVDWFVKVASLKIERTIKILLQYKKRDAKVLDYGCGIGFNIYYFARVFPDVIGIDNDKQSIEIARRQLKKLKCNKKVLHYNGKKLPFKENTFDIVSANDIWEHVENPRLMLKEIYRVLKPDGILFINNPNKLWPIETHYKLPFLSYFPASIANWYVRITGRADRYDDIHLPTYGVFKKSIEEFFNIQDITFDLVTEYRKNKLQKERGVIILLTGTFLQMIGPLERLPILSLFYSAFMSLLKRISIGWVFIGWPKKIS